MYDIKNLFLFKGLNKTELKSICTDYFEIQSFDRGNIIYDSSHFRRAIGVFLCGKGYAGDGHTKKVQFSEGDTFGVAAVFGAGEIYVSRIVARTACKVLFIDEKSLRSIMERYSVCAVNYITFLSDKIRYLNKKIAQYTGENTSTRLYRLLCDNSDENGCVKNANISSLADLTGIGRTSAYRALTELIDSGAIERRNKNIYILDKGIEI